MPEIREEMADASASVEVMVNDYEEKMKTRVKADFENATTFLSEFHTQCVGSYKHYFSASQYVDMKKTNKFPMPFFQQMVDDFVSDNSDKLSYKNQPCTVIPVEDTDKGDAEAKQNLFKWMDYKDNMEGKLEVFLRDCAKYRICVAQVDYDERMQNKLMGTMDETTGQPISSVESQKVPVFRGAIVKRVDPTNFFILQDKQEIGDGKPVMVRSYHPIDYFASKPYFKNIEVMKSAHARRDKPTGVGSEVSEHGHSKRMVHSLHPEKTASGSNIEYIEWQAEVDKKPLYEYLGKPITADVPTIDDLTGLPDGGFETVPTVSDTDKIWCIVGMAEETIIRLEESPFALDRPNVIVGVMQEDEDELIGTSLADKIGAVAQGLDVLMGILLENFRQSVNAGHVINKNALITQGDIVVNKPGWMLLTNTDVDKVHKRIEQPRVAPDIYTMLEYFEQLGRDAGGIQRPISATGGQTADTLGEYESLLEQSNKKMVKYLRSFERTLVQPLYEMRNQINMQFLDQPYIYGIIGEGAIEWRTMQPEQIRANVDFICESSTREANKLVITQQILQLGKLAPLAQEMGFPIRFDILLGRLAEQGFSWNRDMVEEIFPTLKMERENPELNINQMLLENMILELQMKKMMTMMGIAQGGAAMMGGGGGAGPQPRNEGEARSSLSGMNHTQVGRE